MLRLEGGRVGKGDEVSGKVPGTLALLKTELIMVTEVEDEG
jgi:hypothetical protein